MHKILIATAFVVVVAIAVAFDVMAVLHACCREQQVVVQYTSVANERQKKSMCWIIQQRDSVRLATYGEENIIDTGSTVAIVLLYYVR